MMKFHPLGNIFVINATPHPIRFAMGDDVVEIPSDKSAVKAFAAEPTEVEGVAPDVEGIEFVQHTFSHPLMDSTR